MNPGKTPGLDVGRLDRIAPVMQRHVDAGTVAGVSTLVSHAGEVVHTAQFGHRDREAGLPMTPDTIFRIYSMTKPVVSTALMLLHEEAAFQLDQPVARYLPAFGSTKVLEADGSLVPQSRPMEIREVLMHTSGLTYDFMADNAAAAAYREARVMHDASRSLAEVVDLIAEMPLAFQPGTKWHYSVGIDVAARLIEVLSGQSLGDFLSERLFRPLGMTDTAFGVPDDKIDRLAAMYGLPDLIGENYSAVQLVEAALAGFNERIDVAATYPTGTPDVYQRGGVGLFSTIGDYHRFARMLMTGTTADGERIIGRKTLDLMHGNHLRPSQMPVEVMGRPMPGYGFGLGSRSMIDVAQSGTAGSVGEFGWAGAAKTYFWVDPVEELIGVFMSQYMTGVEMPERDFRALVYQAVV